MEKAGSFIPRQAQSGRTPATKTRRIYVFTYVSYVLFFGTLLAVAAVLGFQFLLNRSLEEQKQLLAEQRADFSQSDLIRVRELDERMKQAGVLLDRQAALSTVFSDIEDTTLTTVEFSKVDIKRELPEQFTITLSGGTNSFDSLEFQNQIIDTMEAAGTYEITDVTFGDGDGGGENGEAVDQAISFNLVKTVPTSEIRYRASKQLPAAVAPTNLIESETETEDTSSIQASSTASTTEISAPVNDAAQ